MTKEERLSRALLRATREEKRLVLKAANRLRGKGLVSEGTALSVACDMILAWERAQRKRERDLRSDHRTRRTLGGRVPIDLYERCKRDAESRGISLYRWCLTAFEMALVLPWMD